MKVANNLLVMVMEDDVRGQWLLRIDLGQANDVEGKDGILLILPLFK